MVKCLFSLAIKYHLVFIAMCYCSGLVSQYAKSPSLTEWDARDDERSPLSPGLSLGVKWNVKTPSYSRPWPPPPPPIQETSGDVSSHQARPGSWGIMPPDNGTIQTGETELARREPIRPRSGGLDQREASIQVTWPVSTNQRSRGDGEWTNQRPGRGIIERGAEAPSPRWHGVYICKRDDVL